MRDRWADVLAPTASTNSRRQIWVDILVSRLRKKLDGLSPGCNLISTVRNGGYLMTAQVKQVS